jgi:hypothetical protein
MLERLEHRPGHLSRSGRRAVLGLQSDFGRRYIAAVAFVRGGKAHPLHGTRARNRSILCAAARRLVFVNMPRTAALADDPFDKAA